MYDRRNFVKKLGITTAGLAALNACSAGDTQQEFQANKLPIILSTWNNIQANKIASVHLNDNPGDLLTAIEKGINSVEANPEDSSVGLGGYPDRTGQVTLDACIMDHMGNAGAVTYLKDIVHPISVARKVMESTPHVILSGAGALEFAKDQGFKTTDLLTDTAKEAYRKWLEKSEYKPKINIELHDTIGMVGIDISGNLSGGCSTSGLAFKMPGRVGDSPIIGSGLFVDNEIGCATATGLGELVLKTCSTFLVVELMRQGLSPLEACKTALKRIIDKYDTSNTQVGLIALSKSGDYAGFSIQPGFMFACSIAMETTVIEADSYYS